MSHVTITLDPAAERFYRRVAETRQLPLERVLSDALFKLAGELSLQALTRKASKQQNP